MSTWMPALLAGTAAWMVYGTGGPAAALDGPERTARHAAVGADPRPAPVIPAIYAAPAHAVPGLDSAGEARSLLEAAREAYGRYDLERARELLARAAAVGTRDRVVAVHALRTLAEFDWKFDRDRDAARGRLDQALELEPGSAETLVQRARLARESGDVDAAATDVRAAIDSAADPVLRADALVLQGRLSMDRVRQGAESADVSLAAAIAGVREALRLQPGRSDAAETLVGLGTVARRNDVVLEAVMAYHFLTEPAAAPGILRHAVATLAEIARDRPAGRLSAAAQARQAKALGQARFHDWAAYLARDLPERDHELQALIAYQEFLEGVARVNADIYPQVARGLRDYEEHYDAAMADQARTLLAALGEAADPEATPGRLLEHFMPYIAERFGAEGYFGTTVGFHGLLAGHTVIDERRQVEQHGVEGDFRFVSLDRMISRDFTSWYGTTNVGGWGTASTIVQVRQAYLAAPYRQLSWVVDPDARSDLEARITELESGDLERCMADPHAEPYAVVQRLRLDASDRIHDRLARQGLEGDRLAIGFIAEVLRLTTEATVFAHEGRHALDQLHRAEAFATMADDERELRAKLSEIAYTEDPRYALTAIIGARLDESGGHGMANRRFRELIVHWMDEHRAAIEGLDPERPLIMQLDRLSADQLRTFARTVDRF